MLCERRPTRCFVLPCRAVTMTENPGAFRYAVSGLLIGLALATSARAESQGQLLYETHCIACHNTQIHWRDQRVATNWARLKAEVRRWQSTAALNWSEADIVAVARYLNASIYRFAQTADSRAQLKLPPSRERTLVDASLAGAFTGINELSKCSIPSRHSRADFGLWIKQRDGTVL